MKRTPYKSSAFIPDFDNASSIGEHMLLGLLKISLQFKYLESIVRKSWVVKQGVTYIALFSFYFVILQFHSSLFHDLCYIVNHSLHNLELLATLP